MTLVAALVLMVTSVSGQSINIDFGQPGEGPEDSYGGAGLPGVWNSIEAEHTPFTAPEVIYGLVDIEGNETGVTLYQFGGMEIIDVTSAGVTGDDAELLGDSLVTHSLTLESCFWINGLENGTYEVITYGWMPNEPDVLSRVRFDFHPFTPLVGGEWTGDHVEGVTYSVHMIEVTTGFIGAHVGMAPGGDTVIGAAVNGMQLRLIGDEVPGDVDGDGDVDLVDFADFQLCFSGPGGGPLTSKCSRVDFDSDDDVDLADFGAFQLAFTGAI
jgi:hypothetical protein